MVVASLGTWPFEARDPAPAGIDAVELRLDLMGASMGDLSRIMASVAAYAPRMIATCRPGRTIEKDRVALLAEAARLGAWAVDVEIDAPASSRSAVVSAARSQSCNVIVSFHDYERTPERRALQRIVRRSLAAGADLVKIACHVGALADNATLLGLLDDKTTAGRVAVIGMGPLGRVSRVVAPLLGSPLAYVALERGLETAEGQLTLEALLSAWSVFEDLP